MPAVALPPKPAKLVLAPYQSAEWILDQLTPGGRIVGLCRGHLSLTDLIAATVKRTGPAAVLIAVWGISYEDVNLLQSLRDSGAVTAVRLLVPPKPPHTATKSSRDEGTGPVDDYDALRALFGRENVINTATHAKLAVVENDSWHVAIRGSLNMYACSHAEQFDIDDDEALCACVRAYAAAPQAKAAYPRPETEASNARAVVSRLEQGGRVFGLSEGFSLGALISAILEKTGEARVSVITARLGKREASELATLADLRVVLGQSVVALAKSTARFACDTIGARRVRVAMAHAKIVTIRNDRWNITIRSSMNLSANLRAEQFDVCDDPAVADQADAWISFVFEKTPAGIDTAQTTLSNVDRHTFGAGGVMSELEKTRGPIVLSAFHVAPIRLRATPPVARPLHQLSLALPPPSAAAKSALPRA